jgi:tRNA pseudouridine55 synthase
MDSAQFNGFVLIDKPAGLSSFDVIRQLRKKTGIRTFGHAGTLDPFATGLLIIAVNKYTRLLSLLDNAEKSYTATLELGSATSTGDPEGEVITSSQAAIDPVKLDTLTAAVLAIQALQPPRHSAVKVEGKRAYTRARADEVFDLPERESHIYEFKILYFNYPLLKYVCRVSKGTYIRSLSQWIAAWLGSVGYTKELRRTSIGNVDVGRAAQLVEITSDNIQDHFLSVLDILPELEKVILTDADLATLRLGRTLDSEGSDNTRLLVLDSTLQGRGIAFRQSNQLHPKVNL